MVCQTFSDFVLRCSGAKLAAYARKASAIGDCRRGFVFRVCEGGYAGKGRESLSWHLLRALRPPSHRNSDHVDVDIEIKPATPRRFFQSFS